MQVFITGTPLATAKILNPRHLRNQINETRIILDALNGVKAWSNHPCVLQYRGHKEWLWFYMSTLAEYYQYTIRKKEDEEEDEGEENIKIKIWNDNAIKLTPPFHNEEFFNQMKRRLYTKNPQHYSQWSDLGESQENWYFVDGVMRKYINGKRIE